MTKRLNEMKTLLYGDVRQFTMYISAHGPTPRFRLLIVVMATAQDDQEAKPEKCAQLAQLLIQSKLVPQLVAGLAGLPFEARKQFAQIFNNLMRRDLAGFVGYVERNSELLSTLVAGYENPDIALNCGTMLREVRLQVPIDFVARMTVSSR